MSTYEIIAVVLSAVALAFSIATIIKDIYTAYRNRITADTLTLKLEPLRVSSAGFNDWIHCNLLLTNHTRKEFTVGRIVVTINDTPCRSWCAAGKAQKIGEQPRLRELHPFRVMPHDIVNIDFHIEAPHLEAPTVGTLSVMTSYRKIDYTVLIPCDSENDSDKG